MLVVERALGHRLPKGAQVHHVNHDPSDNRPQNLVACQSAAYHSMIHRREEALRATGDAGARRCSICHEWCRRDDGDARRRGAHTRHLRCEREAQRTARARRKAA